MKLQRSVMVGGRELVIETGRIAKQADGAVTFRLGDTIVLATACRQTSAAPRDFLPLTVDYREYTYAAGKIPGGFFKREGRPSEKEIITSRLIDRPLRPLFPDGYFFETQIISSVLSADGVNDPDILAINAASTALALSDIPFYHGVGAVRVGLIDGQLVFNPTNAERDISDLDLVVCGTTDAVVMVEAGANQLPEAVVLDAIFKGHEEIQKVLLAQAEMFRELGLKKPVWSAPEPWPAELYTSVKADLWEPLKSALNTKGKFERAAAVKGVLSPYYADKALDEETLGKVKKIVHQLEDELLRDAVLNVGKRFDGRDLDEIRDITIETGVLPRAHGSALFTRGETQALVSATLGTKRDAQIIEEYEGESRQSFLLHYNFPPFSVGEVKFLRGPGRREIGHGVLARRSLIPLLPSEEEFPYTVRVVSDIMESNGSSSMATVCGGSLALFDAGVPMGGGVAGVAMGLIKVDDRFAVLSDIAGQEDHHGDMDFKVAGTTDGVTALQMDIKITGVDREIMNQALAQARRGRLHILEIMEQALAAPRPEMSPYAPRMTTISIPSEKIRDVIGPGGKTIRAIQEETGCEIEIDKDGRVTISSSSGVASARAREIIESLTEMPEVGKNYVGKVRRVEAYGAFVEIIPGTEGLLHVSELAPYRVREVTDVVREGDEIEVKVIEIDPDAGRIRLSRKAVIMEAPDYDPADYAGMGEPEPERGPRDGDRGGRPGGDRRGGRPGGGGGRPGGGGFRGRR